jgi:hypothetical protein
MQWKSPEMGGSASRKCPIAIRRWIAYFAQLDNLRIACMTTRLISPLVSPLLVLCSGYLLGRVADYYQAPRKKIGFWVVLASWIACFKYALEWHNEIGEAWQSHPNIALGLTLIVFMILSMTAIVTVRPKLKRIE